MYDVWVTANNGDDIPQKLEDWDGESGLELRLAAFANDAVIFIEPQAPKEDND